MFHSRIVCIVDSPGEGSEPGAEHLIVDSPVSEVSTLRIFSSSGQQIVASQGNTAVTTSLPKGIYLLSIRLKDGTMVNKKFAKNL